MRTQKRRVLRTVVNPHISSITDQSLSLVVHSFLNHGGPVKFVIDCSLGPVKSFRKFLAQKMRNALSVDLKIDFAKVFKFCFRLTDIGLKWSSVLFFEKACMPDFIHAI